MCRAWLVRGLSAMARSRSSSATTSYVVSYGVCPLYDPTKASPAGSVVPLRFMLCSFTGENLSSSDVQVRATGLRLTSTEASDVVEDAGNANPDSDFRFAGGLDGGGGYVYNLSTKGLSTGTWAMLFSATGDPAVHRLPFQLR